MGEWATVFLGVIAFSTLIMALIQVGMLITAARALRKTATSVARIEATLEPLSVTIDNLAQRTTHVVDRVGDTVDRIEHFVDAAGNQFGRASDALEAGVRMPVREAAAVIAGVQAAATSVRRKLSQTARWSRGAVRPHAGIDGSPREDAADEALSDYFGG